MNLGLILRWFKLISVDYIYQSPQAKLDKNCTSYTELQETLIPYVHKSIGKLEKHSEKNQTSENMETMSTFRDYQDSYTDMVKDVIDICKDCKSYIEPTSVEKFEEIESLKSTQLNILQ